MENFLVCLMLISLHATWVASLPLEKAFTSGADGTNKAMSTLRRYGPNDVTFGIGTQFVSKIPGPGGQRIEAGGLPSKRVPLSKLTPPKSAVRQAEYSAFTVYKTAQQVGNMSDILTFDSITTNEGNNFDISTSIFTCTIPGTYVFSFTIITQDYPIMNLVKNQEVIATVFRSYDGAGLYDTISNQAVVQLQANDQVFLMFMGYDEQSVYGDPYYKYTIFSGYLLH